MPEFTVTLTDEDVLVLESEYETALEGLYAILERQLMVKTQNAILESDSKMDPRKMTKEEMKAEVASLGKDGMNKIKAKRV